MTLAADLEKAAQKPDPLRSYRGSERRRQQVLAAMKRYRQRRKAAK